MQRVKVEYEDIYFLVDGELIKFENQFKRVFPRLYSIVKEDNRIAAVMFFYDKILQGNTIGFYTHRCEVFRARETFLEDCSNIQEVCSDLIGRWNQVPTEDYWKEQAEGIFEGKRIRFNRIFSGYRFSDKEVEDLLKGEIIEFKDANNREWKGHLADLEYYDFRYYGFKSIPKIPEVLLDVKLEKDQIKALENNHKVWVSGMRSKKTGNIFSCYVYFDKEEGIKFDFNTKLIDGKFII